MKKSGLKKIILEALTPDEATKVDSKYKEIYSGMLKTNPLKLKKYDNPDAVAYGRAIKLVQKESKLKEVYSEKQRKWACAQDDPKFDEMCKDTAISKKKTMENTRLQELIKSALMGPISEKQRPDYPDVDGDGDTKEPMVKALKDKEKSEANEDVVKGSNIKKVGDDWRVLSGKTGKMWKQKYDSKEDAEAALRGYFANLSEAILNELKGNVKEAEPAPEKKIQDIELIKKYLPKINTKKEYLSILNIVLNMGNEIPGITPILKKQSLLAFIKTLGK